MPGGHQRPARSGAVSGSKQLTDILGVLRRQQTKVDRNAKVLSSLSRPGPPMALHGTPDLPLVRFAMTTPWGEKLYLVPMKPPTAAQLASFARRFPASARLISRLSGQGETLTVSGSQGGNVGGATAPSIEARTDWSTEGDGPGASTVTRLFLVVPDGVARVELVLPREPLPPIPGTPIYPHSLRVTVPVHDNVAAMQIDRVCCSGRIPMVWYGADGWVLKRFADFAAVNRVISPPKPGPETALSWAAERDPSTTNPVWVTPRNGGPHTTFAIQFRLLLSGAEYRYRPSGTRSQGRFRGGFAGGVRGRIWSENLAYPRQAWCPGTYRVSVSVMDLGPAGNLKRSARPFGSAAFTVRSGRT